MMKDFIQKLVDGRDLTGAEASAAMKAIMSGESNDAQNASFLTALRMKGETATEIAAMVKVMRDFAENINPKVEGRLVDTCGTGGDKLSTFNVSTTSMFVVAGTGIPIAKHGNRSVSSKCGSADVLEALKVKIDLAPPKVEKCIEKVGVGFMFAPVFHKSMKNVMPARKAMGIRTIFNVLGPLTNPANAKGQIVGVFDGALTEKLAEVLRLVGVERAFVVHGVNGLDEVSTVCETKVSELFEDGSVKTYSISPEEYGMMRAHAKDLIGGDAKENAKILKGILSGKVDGPKRDMVVLNAATGIICGGRTDSIKEGIKLAEESIDSGSAIKKLKDMISYCKKL
ncbi:MAG: anthranilate phosphoribosyltransferase [Candidatus Altiarchaeota archaeon]